MQKFAMDLCFTFCGKHFLFFNIFLLRLVFTRRDKVNVAYYHILLKRTVHVIHPGLKVDPCRYNKQSVVLSSLATQCTVDPTHFIQLHFT